MTAAIIDEVLLGLLQGFGTAFVIVGILAIGYAIVCWLQQR